MMANDRQPHLAPHERQTASELHPSHVDTGGVEYGAAEDAEGTDAAQVYYQGALHHLNHEGDFDETWHPKKHTPSTEHDWSALHRPDRWQVLAAADADTLEHSTDLINFNARSVVVHNWSTQHVYVPDARTWVPPGAFNVILALPAAISVARFTFAPPTGVTQPAATVAETVVTLWTERVMDPSPGLQIPSLVQPAVIVGGSTVSGAGSVLVTGPLSPTAANVLDGNVVGAGTLLSIPANRTWIGIVTLSATLVAGASAVAASANPVVTTTGGTVTPAAGNVLSVRLDTPLQVAGSTAQVAQTASSRVVVIAGSSPATLALVLNGASGANASAIGELL